jgi:hypothetical protein
MTVARELARYKLDLVSVEEVRWDNGGTLRAEDFTFFYTKGNENYEVGAGLFVHQKIVSAVMTVESVNDRMSYIAPKQVIGTQGRHFGHSVTSPQDAQMWIRSVRT